MTIRKTLTAFYERDPKRQTIELSLSLSSRNSSNPRQRGAFKHEADIQIGGPGRYYVSFPDIDTAKRFVVEFHQREYPTRYLNHVGAGGQ